MKKICKHCLCGLLLMWSVNAVSQPTTIKIGIYYTSAAGSLELSYVNAQIAKVQNVLDDISADTYKAVLTSFAQIDYKEPKHRSGDYTIGAYNGMRQTFAELVDQVAAYSYYKDLSGTGSLGKLENIKTEVDGDYANLDLAVQSDINIFIVDEEGTDDYFFITFNNHVIDRSDVKLS